MRVKRFISRHAGELFGKTAAVTGATGGIGQPLCFFLAALGANLVLIGRNEKKLCQLSENIQKKYPGRKISVLVVDLVDSHSAEILARKLLKTVPDYLFLNAGAYKIPRATTKSGVDNVFQINFLSPYLLTKKLLPVLRENGGKVVAVGSIAYRYGVYDKNDPDYATRRAPSAVYGNSKRFLMFSLYELFKTETKAKLTVCHPGITFTNITSHYPPLLFALIKYPMKVIFMSARKAALCILAGCFAEGGYFYWVGPRWFDIWGAPVRKKLHGVNDDEVKSVFAVAQEFAEKNR